MTEIASVLPRGAVEILIKATQHPVAGRFTSLKDDQQLEREMALRDAVKTVRSKYPKYFQAAQKGE